MSDRHIQITSFKYGLDTRRSELSVQPGTLVTCENAFINAGGEVEKRKAFVKDAVLFPADTYGLESTDVGLLTFYSGVSVLNVARAANVATIETKENHGYINGDVVNVAGVTLAGFDTIAAGVAVTRVDDTHFTYANTGGAVGETVDQTGYCRKHSYLTLPTGVTAQRLAHPYGMNMTAVTASCNYKGKAFVIARYGTDWLFFYDGALVQHSRNGVILNGMLNANSKVDVGLLSTDLVRQIEEITGWSGTANKYAGGGNYGGMTSIKSPTEIYFSMIPEIIKSDHGDIYAIPYDRDGAATTGDDAPVNAKGAIAKFRITASTAGGWVTITAPAAADGTGTVYLCDSLDTQATPEAMAGSIVNQINLTKPHGYSALCYLGAAGSPDAWDVFIYAPAEFGAGINGDTLGIAFADANVFTYVTMTAKGPNLAKLIFNPTGVTWDSLSEKGQFYCVCEVTVSTQGGSGTFSYKWEKGTDVEVNPGIWRINGDTTQPKVVVYIPRKWYNSSFEEVTQAEVHGELVCTVKELDSVNYPDIPTIVETVRVDVIFP